MSNDPTIAAACGGLAARLTHTSLLQPLLLPLLSKGNDRFRTCILCLLQVTQLMPICITPELQALDDAALAQHLITYVC